MLQNWGKGTKVEMTSIVHCKISGLKPVGLDDVLYQM